jgi:hypothetical protein
MYPRPKSSGKINSPDTEGGYPVDDDFLEPPRQNTSVIRLDSPQSMPPQRITGSTLQNTPVPVRRQSQTISRDLPRQTRANGPQTPYEKVKAKGNVHWLLPLGIGMICMLVLWMLGASVLAWGIQRSNDLRYGNPRTYQVNAVVGHNDDAKHPSHFIAVNLNRQAIIFEIMGGDPAKSVSYVVPVYIAGDGGDLAPVTLEFRDVTGDGKLDMVVHIHLPNQDQVSVFVNDGGRFRPSNGTDKITL